MEREIINNLLLFPHWDLREDPQAAVVLLLNLTLNQKFDSRVGKGLCMMDLNIVDLRINWSASDKVRQEICLMLSFLS